ncbi:MAG: ATPase [Treponema sp.]|nr:ATPase [Treponema sp.]
MEELHTTEVLDREILEDARKKAFKILKTADDSIGSSKASWDKKFKRSEGKVRADYAKKEDQLQLEIMARLPMDKSRIRLETIDRFLHKAMEEFLASLDRASLLYIMKRELDKRKEEISLIFSDSPDHLKQSVAVSLRYRAVSKEECSDLVGSFGGISFSYNEDPLYMIPGSFPAMVIDFAQLRITVSVDNAAEALLLDKRAELAAALLGNIKDLFLPVSTVHVHTVSGNDAVTGSFNGGGGDG